MNAVLLNLNYYACCLSERDKYKENVKNVLNKFNNDHAACVSVLVTKILFLNF